MTVSSAILIGILKVSDHHVDEYMKGLTMPVKSARKSAVKRPAKQPKPGTPKKKRDTVVMFQSEADHLFYWYALGRDGSSVAIGGEGYVKRAGVKRNRLVKLALANGFTFEDVGVRYVTPAAAHALVGMRNALARATPKDQGTGVNATQADAQPSGVSAVDKHRAQQFGSTPVAVSNAIGSTPIDAGSGNPVQGSAGDEHNPDVSKP